MSEEKKPPRSLRGSGGPRYYRDWSAADEVIGSPETDTTASAAPTEMRMVEGIEDAFDSEPAHPAPAIPGQEMAPLNVIIPEQKTDSAPVVPEKPKVTRIDRSKIQRARRYSEIKADEEAQKQAEIEKQAEAARKAKAAQPAKTGVLKPTATNKTSELQSNIKEIGGTLDNAKESVKDTADALSQNIKDLGEKLTDTIVGGIQKMGRSINNLLGRRGKKAAETHLDDEDFEDAPLPTPSGANSVGAKNTSRGKPQQAPPAPLAQIPEVPLVWYSDLLKEKVYFLTFDKKQMVDAPETMERNDLQKMFVENALQDIRKCIKLVKDLPDPTKGPYSGLPLSYIFKHIRDQDIYFFMHYVLSKPDPFRKKTFKLSEAFATWILKRSDNTIVSEPFPEIPPISYYPLYKANIRFQTVERKQLVLAAGKSSEEVDLAFMERALEDVKGCIKLVEKFPAAQAGPYQSKPLKQIFRYVKPRDIYFFLHYIDAQPEIFRGKNFKFSEAFASWILKRSHETKIP